MLLGFIHGGKRCRSEDPERLGENCAIPGIHSSWVTDDIVAMARPSTHNVEKHGSVKAMVDANIGAIFNSSGNLREFTQVTRSKFVFVGDLWQLNLSGDHTSTSYTLRFAPKTAQSIFGNLAISNVNSTLASGCSFRLKPSSTASSGCFAQARSDSSGIAHCEMTVNPSTPGVIYYEIESWGGGTCLSTQIRSKGYHDDLVSY